ncbi:phage holin family protein [Sorangium sp. So ce131]|uniref:phage holin family protein n=1 Tax=Sorangium sp. So ce131 TaxID=3133282 RepID=UPI003F5FB2C6
MIKTFLIQAIAAGVAVLVGAKLMPGVRLRRTKTAVGVAAVFALLNLLLGWLVTFLVKVALLPVAFLTFGLAYLFLGILVNSVLLWATDKLIDDFDVKGFGPLLGTASLISLAGWLLPRLF